MDKCKFKVGDIIRFTGCTRDAECKTCDAECAYSGTDDDYHEITIRRLHWSIDHWHLTGPASEDHIDEDVAERTEKSERIERMCSCK